VGTNGRPPTEYWQDCEHGEIPDATLPAHATTRATTASDVPLTLCAIVISGKRAQLQKTLTFVLEFDLFRAAEGEGVMVVVFKHNVDRDLFVVIYYASAPALVIIVSLRDATTASYWEI
jgi:hypothetical protein